MAVPLDEPSEYTEIWHNQFQIKDNRQQPGAFRWWQPDCVFGVPSACEECWTGCKGNEPVLLNGWAQPTQASLLEKFAFRLHADGSLEFKGHLDSAGAVSGTVACILPGAVLGEDEFRLPNDQFFLTVIYDGAIPQPAMVYITGATGEITITFPV